MPMNETTQANATAQTARGCENGLGGFSPSTEDVVVVWLCELMRRVSRLSFDLGDGGDDVLEGGQRLLQGVAVGGREQLQPGGDQLRAPFAVSPEPRDALG